jgi:DNA polymerase I-like protein with 3'-5' exonuclease and polymerase domains
MQGNALDKDQVIAAQMNEPPELAWNIPTEFPDLRQHKQIAIDLETCDPHLTTLGPGWARKDGFIVGIAVAAGDWEGYFPIRHSNGHNLDPKMTMKWLRAQMATPHIDKIMHNATYDLGWLRAEGVNVQGRIIDTMITGAIVDETRMSYSLNNLGRDYLAERKNEKLLRVAAAEWGLDPKAEMYKLPPTFVGRYAEQDAGMTLRLWERLKLELKEHDLWNIWELETSLIPMMCDMRQAGVRVDVRKAEQAKRLFKKRSVELKDEIHRLTGVRVEPWAAASVATVFDALGLHYPRNKTEQRDMFRKGGSPSFTKQWLSAHDHPVAQMIVSLREVDKADSTFIDSILRHEHKGRIHTEFHQLRSDDGGTVTGRFCVAADTLIETQRGPVPIVDIKPRQDKAVTHLGRLQPIRHLIYKGEEEMVALRVSSGSVVKCTRNHRVMTDSGWMKVGDLTVGQEICGVDIQKGSSQQGALPESGGVLPFRGQAQPQGSGGEARGDIPLRTGHGQYSSHRGANEGREGSPVLSVQAWHKKRDGGENRQLAPELQGPPVLRPAWVHSGAQAELVHGEADVEPRLRASGGYGADAWLDRGPRGYECAPHQREPRGQLTAQPSVGDTGGSSLTTRSVTVEEIKPLGVAQVWDIEVETDHSYVAHGLIHHNSSSNPNLQQIPARDPEIKKIMRGLFIPEDGTQWGSFDYSSQEPRLLVHFAASIRGPDRHDMIDDVVKAYNEGDVDLHQMVADFAGITRKEAKVVNLGIMYGMGKAKLAKQLGITEEAAGGLLATHHNKVPFVKGLADLATQQAGKNGLIRTLLGRRCNFHLWEPRTYGYNQPLPFDKAIATYGQPLRRAFTYKALNKLIQGSAADQTKKAMADCHAEGLLPMLTVHDELCFSVESAEQANRIQEIMETGLSHVLKVPSKVDAEMGANWGEVG